MDHTNIGCEDRQLLDSLSFILAAPAKEQIKPNYKFQLSYLNFQATTFPSCVPLLGSLHSFQTLDQTATIPGLQSPNSSGIWHERKVTWCKKQDLVMYLTS